MVVARIAHVSGKEDTGMPRPSVDADRFRVAIRRMKRDQLLDLLDQAIDLVPKSRLADLANAHVPPESFAKSKATKKSLLDEVRAFHTAAMRGEYYEGFNVNSKNFMDQSEGTQTFIAEFERIMDRCVKAVEKVPANELREAFDLLLSILRHIDQGNDDVVFFADEAGSWQVGVDWRATLPAYFACVAASAEPEEFARLALGASRDFADYDRGKLLTEARRVASKEQKAALRKLTTQKLP